MQDEPPTWPSDSDDNMGLESISEPDDMDMDMEDDDAEAEQFFDTRSESASMSSASQHGRGGGSKSEDIDTEEDPVDPITPGPNSKFELGGQPERSKGSNFDAEGDSERFDDDIEDDWVDPSLPSPSQSGPPPLPAKDNLTPASPLQAPALAKSISAGSTKKRKGKKGQIPVPVPLVKIPSSSAEHYPFPVAQRPADDSSSPPLDRSQDFSDQATNGKRMHTARARDGGRTQSGGVKGVLTDT